MGDTTLLPASIDELMSHSEKVLIGRIRSLTTTPAMPDSSAPHLTVSTATAEIEVLSDLAGPKTAATVSIRYETLPRDPGHPQPKLKVGDSALFFLVESGKGYSFLTHPVFGAVLEENGAYPLSLSDLRMPPLYPTRSTLPSILKAYRLGSAKTRSRSFSIRAAFFPYDPDGKDWRTWPQRKPTASGTGEAAHGR